MDLLGKPCLVIGGRHEACDKITRLLTAGAKLKVVAPAVDDKIKEWAATGKIVYHRRRFQSRDMLGTNLVINTVRSDTNLCHRVFTQARRKRIPINTFDLPQYSTLAMAALVAHGPLRISISTSNASPSLASRLRQDLEILLDSSSSFEMTPPDTPIDENTELEQFLDKLSTIRVLAKKKILSSTDRKTLLRGLTQDFRLVGKLYFPSQWRQRFTQIEEQLKKNNPK